VHTHLGVLPVAERISVRIKVLTKMLLKIRKSSRLLLRVER